MANSKITVLEKYIRDMENMIDIMRSVQTFKWSKKDKKDMEGKLKKLISKHKNLMDTWTILRKLQ